MIQLRSGFAGRTEYEKKIEMYRQIAKLETCVASEREASTESRMYKECSFVR